MLSKAFRLWNKNILQGMNEEERLKWEYYESSRILKDKERNDKINNQRNLLKKLLNYLNGKMTPDKLDVLRKKFNQWKENIKLPINGFEKNNLHNKVNGVIL